MENDQYVETGGLYWGPILRGGFYCHWRASWPLAEITVSSTCIRITVNNWLVRPRTEVMEFEKAEVTVVRKRNGLLSTGAQFEHLKTDAPPTVVFWASRRTGLFTELRRFGYSTLE
jgi:hypothetical protein